MAQDSPWASAENAEGPEETGPAAEQHDADAHDTTPHPHIEARHDGRQWERPTAEDADRAMARRRRTASLRLSYLLASGGSEPFDALGRQRPTDTHQMRRELEGYLCAHDHLVEAGAGDGLYPSWVLAEMQRNGAA